MMPADTPAGGAPSEPSRNAALIIDDEATIRSALRRYFTRRGWDVEEAADGAGGLQILSEGPDRFTVVLCDLRMRRAGYSVAYADGAIAYTEAPDTLRGLAKQRFRWSFGTLQCTWKHRDAFLRPRYGSLGFVGLPNVFLFQLLLPAISPVADLMFLWSIASVWFNARVHTVDGRLAYALPNLEQVLVLLHHSAAAGRVDHDVLRA